MPPTKRFQIHLSTAIVLMFVAGGLMLANLHLYLIESDLWTINNQDGTTQHPFVGKKHGWPLHYGIEDLGTLQSMPGEEVRLLKFVLNLLVALAILYATRFFCEWLIRRRAAQKKS